MTGASEIGVVRAVVCEDEPLARRAIEAYLSDVAWIEIVGQASEGREALRLIHKLEPDLVFLDVRMPGMDGIAVLDALEHRPAVVFTTAFDEYALKAFEHGAVDYLVKPFGRDRLIQTLDRVRIRLVGEIRTAGAEEERVCSERRAYADRIFARHRGAMVPVRVEEIRSVDAVDGGVAIRVGDRVLELDCSLSEIEGRLDPRDFVRIHRGHLVNLARVRGIRRYDERRFVVTLDDDSTIVASRAGSRALRDLMA